MPQDARLKIAADLGDGLFAVEPDGDLVRTWRVRGDGARLRGDAAGPGALDEKKAVRAVLEKNSFALTGWKVVAELPNPASFEAATASVTPDQVAAQFACGPDPGGFLGFFASELAGPLRALTPRRRASPDQ